MGLIYSSGTANLLFSVQTLFLEPAIEGAFDGNEAVGEESLNVDCAARHH
jgi:hypothetical protein